MSKAFNTSLVVLVFLIMWYKPIDGTGNEIHAASYSAFLPKHNQRPTLAEDLLSVLSVFKTNVSLRLYLLHDQYHKDYTQIIGRLPKEKQGGVMIFEYDSSLETLKLLLSSSTSNTVILVLCSPKIILEIFMSIGAKRLETKSAMWLLMCTNQPELKCDLASRLNGLIKEGTRVTLVTKDLLGTSKVYLARVSLDGVVRMVSSGSWNEDIDPLSSHSLQEIKSDLISEYADMKGRQLTIASNDVAPFLVLGETLKDGSIKPKSGYEVMLLQALSHALNFTYRVKVPADRSYGNILPNGTATGAIGMVQKGEANFALSVLTITEARETAVDFGYPYYYTTITLLSKAPPLKSRTFAILSTYSAQVWLYIIITVVAIGPTLKALAVISESILYENSNESLQVYMFNMFRNLVLQENRLKDQYIYKRVAFLSWFLFCLVVTALYSGNLTAVFAIPVYEKPIDSLTDLPRAVQDGYSLATGKGTSMEALFKEAKEGIYKQTWELFDSRKQKLPSLIGSTPNRYATFAKYIESKFVIIMFEPTAQVFAGMYGREKFHIGIETFSPQLIGIACPTGLAIKHALDNEVLHMIEGGLINKWFRDDLSKTAVNTPKEETESKASAITISQLQAAFYLLLAGLFVASLVLLIEAMLA